MIFRPLSPDGSRVGPCSGLRAWAPLAAGRKIVKETGYGRRDGAVKELEEQLG